MCRGTSNGGIPTKTGGAGDWVEFAATFEQVGTNFRYPANPVIYFAVTDLEYTPGGYVPGTGVYTGWTWSEAMGIAAIYQTTAFTGTTGTIVDGYVPTEYTGCGAYWEGSPTDPVTGQGQWQMPPSGAFSNPTTRTNYLTPGNYLGIPVGAIDLSTTTYYMSCNNNATNFTANIPGASGTNNVSTAKSSTNIRVRCIRRVQ